MHDFVSRLVSQAKTAAEAKHDEGKPSAVASPSATKAIEAAEAAEATEAAASEMATDAVRPDKRMAAEFDQRMRAEIDKRLATEKRAAAAEERAREAERAVGTLEEQAAALRQQLKEALGCESWSPPWVRTQFNAALDRERERPSPVSADQSPLDHVRLARSLAKQLVANLA